MNQAVNDGLREEKIGLYYLLAVTSKGRDLRREYIRKMESEVSLRSPAQIARMEELHGVSHG
jgi:hypothetical protein